NFDDRRTQIHEIWQPVDGGAERPTLGERSHVELVNHLPLDLHAAPRAVAPLISRRVDQHRGTVRAVGLVPRGWIGVQVLSAVDSEWIESGGVRLHEAGEVAVPLGR